MEKLGSKIGDRGSGGSSAASAETQYQPKVNVPKPGDVSQGRSACFLWLTQPQSDEKCSNMGGMTQKDFSAILKKTKSTDVVAANGTAVGTFREAVLGLVVGCRNETEGSALDPVSIAVGKMKDAMTALDDKGMMTGKGVKAFNGFFPKGTDVRSQLERMDVSVPGQVSLDGTRLNVNDVKNVAKKILIDGLIALAKTVQILKFESSYKEIAAQREHGYKFQLPMRPEWMKTDMLSEDIQELMSDSASANREHDADQVRAQVRRPSATSKGFLQFKGAVPTTEGTDSGFNDGSSTASGFAPGGLSHRSNGMSVRGPRKVEMYRGADGRMHFGASPKPVLPPTRPTAAKPGYLMVAASATATEPVSPSARMATVWDGNYQGSLDASQQRGSTFGRGQYMDVSEASEAFDAFLTDCTAKAGGRVGQGYDLASRLLLSVFEQPPSTTVQSGTSGYASNAHGRTFYADSFSPSDGLTSRAAPLSASQLPTASGGRHVLHSQHHPDHHDVYLDMVFSDGIQANADMMKSGDVADLVGNEWYPTSAENSPKTIGKYEISLEAVKDYSGNVPGCTVYKLQIKNTSTGESKPFTKLHYNNWADYSAAQVDSVVGVNSILCQELGDDFMQTACVDWNCRATIGRGPTAFIINNLLEMERLGQPVTREMAIEMVMTLKLFRHMEAVQTGEQFEMILSVVDGISAHQGGSTA